MNKFEEMLNVVRGGFAMCPQCQTQGCEGLSLNCCRGGEELMKPER